MGETVDQLKKLYEDEKASLKSETASLIGEIKINIDLKKNENYEMK